MRWDVGDVINNNSKSNRDIRILDFSPRPLVQRF